MVADCILQNLEWQAFAESSNGNMPLAISKDGFAYVGFELGCSWDEEHGLGVLTHKDHVVKIGEAETAFEESGLEPDDSL